MVREIAGYIIKSVPMTSSRMPPTRNQPQPDRFSLTEIERAIQKMPERTIKALKMRLNET